jgi:hypothetical protein
MLPMLDDDEEPGLHPVEPFARLCSDPGHHPPSMLYIPHGMKYVHYCPTCCAKSVLFGDMVSMKVAHAAH